MSVILTAILCAYLGYQWGNAGIRNERAARRVAEAAYRASERDHERTRNAWADERAGATVLRPAWQHPTVQSYAPDETPTYIAALADHESKRADWSVVETWGDEA